MSEPLRNTEGTCLYEKAESHWAPQSQDHLEADVPSAAIEFTFGGKLHERWQINAYRIK